MGGRDDQMCKAKVGLLFLRDCGSIVKDNCGQCGRPVCRDHLVKGESGFVCSECAAKTKGMSKKPNAVSTFNRNRYYHSYGYSPWYFGHSHYYSDRDYQTFESTEMDYHEPDTDMDMVDAAVMDDYMES